MCFADLRGRKTATTNFCSPGNLPQNKMLLFAMFTLGYFFGVFMTLFVFGRKEKVEEYPARDNARDLSSAVTDSWEVFRELTKPNYQAGKVVEESGKIATNQVLQ